MAKVLCGRGVSSACNKAVMIEKWTKDLGGGEIDLPEEYSEIVVAEGYTYEQADRLRRQILRATKAKDKLQAERDRAAASAEGAPVRALAATGAAPVATAVNVAVPGFGSPTRRSSFAPAPTTQTRRTPSGRTALVLCNPDCSPIRIHRP
jgi:hypothetical protein